MTDAVLFEQRRSGRRSWLSARHAVALLLLGIAVVLRAADFANTIPGDDEQYYLLVAQRLLHGDLPYVDIWDRKPFGLFALLATVMAIGGDPIATTALAATLAAAGTAFLIVQIAQRGVALLPALGAGVFYLAMLELFAGDTIQTAVFYNLPVVGAVLLALRTDPALDHGVDRWRVRAAMLLLGLALTVKTMAVFEAAAIGLWLIARIARRCGPATAARWALACAAIGLAPTLAIALGFAALGAFDAWWFANFVSQLHKTGGFGTASLMRLPFIVPGLVLLGGVGAFAWKRTPTADRGLVTAWYLAALVQVFAIGNFWALYVLPLTAPAAIFAAQLFAIPRRGKAIFVALCVAAFAKGTVLDRLDTAERRRTTDVVMATLSPDTRRTCLLAYNAPEIFYLLSDACLPSPYLFVDQFRSAAEAKALPVDATIALRAALVRRPGTILTVDNVSWPQPNRTNDRLIAQALARDYRRVADVPWRTALHGEVIGVWRRNDLPVR